MTREEYQQYLQTEHWQRLRNAVLERDGKKCVRCEWPVRLQVHHKIYRDTPQDTLLEDLETLCEKCHSGAHGKEFKPRQVPQWVARKQERDALKSPQEIARLRKAQLWEANKQAGINRWLLDGNRREFKPRFKSVDTNRQNFSEAPVKNVRVKIPKWIRRYGARYQRKMAHQISSKQDRRCRVCGQEHPLFKELIEGKEWLMYRCTFGSQDSDPFKFMELPPR